jgi:hypothetical protein
MSGMWLATCRSAVRLAGQAYSESDGMSMSDKPEQAAPDQTVDEVISDCDGDPRVAVAELLAIIRSLIHENQTLLEAASPGFARHRPIAFGRSK